MIWVGLTSWGDHPSLYDQGSHSTKLQMYASHFPIVECDSSFYAILPKENYVNWIAETPPVFKFIVKAYQGLTGHKKQDPAYQGIGEMFADFKASIKPLIDAGKCAMVLFQYPPWFKCEKKNIDILRYTKAKMEDIPVALEFRHQSWFQGDMREKTLRFIKNEGWIHTICDEPQAGSGSIPLVMAAEGDAALIRLHGRNVEGWLNHGPNRKKFRCLYRYNYGELMQWKGRLDDLKTKVKDIYVLFNNNSGGDAADNGKQLLDMLGIEYKGLAPKQLGFF